VAFIDDLSLPGKGAGAIFGLIASALKAIGRQNTPTDADVLGGWIQADMAIQGLKGRGKQPVG